MIKFLIFGVNKVPKEQMTSLQIAYSLYEYYKALNTRRKQIYLKIKPRKNSLKEFVKESKQSNNISGITTQVPVSKNLPLPTLKKPTKTVTTKVTNRFPLDDDIRKLYPEFNIHVSNFDQRVSIYDAVKVEVRLKNFTYCSESTTFSDVITYTEMLNRVKSLTQRVEVRNAKLLPLTYEYCKPLIPIGYKFILETLHDTCLRCTIYKDGYKINEVVTFNIVNLGESLDREVCRIIKQIVARYQISRRSGRNYYGYW